MQLSILLVTPWFHSPLVPSLVKKNISLHCAAPTNYDLAHLKTHSRRRGACRHNNLWNLADDDDDELVLYCSVVSASLNNIFPAEIKTQHVHELISLGARRVSIKFVRLFQLRIIVDSVCFYENSSVVADPNFNTSILYINEWMKRKI